ncbi:hypothetical protein CC80DRAFT_489702 [Byssothecium circinans]|uniref:PHD-type domain-containing protein n=1 Tax=Byssothecium circinans TaxID=147558 RepID=A0A6A5U6H5_9PLEO|nr:hypothetical protein CC80DRAFT_489702 [Byssothecium circinans]
MDPSKLPSGPQTSTNGPPNPVSGASHLNPTTLSTSTPQPQLQPKMPAPTQAAPWAAHTTTFPASSSGASNFPQFSASTAEILKRLQASNSNATGTPAFEAKRAEVMQNYMTSDKLPTPPPVANTGRRGRGGRNATAGREAGGGSTGSTPASGRGSGRGRGRGRGGGRGGKRKRAESVESDDDSDISSSYTPLPTRTKSGRNVNKPVAFVPTLPEPTQGVKRRRSTKTILAAQCKVCHRGTDPANNRIVFCDMCTTAYHQYCHDPPIDNDVVNVLEKEWLCGPCDRSKQNIVEGTDGLVAAPEGLSIDDKRAYLSTLPQARLVSLLLHATIRHPELPIFPPNVRNLIPDQPTTATSTTAPQAPSLSKPTPIPKHLPPSPQNGHPASTGTTPHSTTHLTTSNSSEMDPAEAQILGEINHSSHQHPHPHPFINSKPLPPPATTIHPSSTNINNSTNINTLPSDQPDEYDDGYDTDPPAHYPKPGNGLARTLRPESEDLQWLVDDNFEVFSHGWKGDGSGVGADAAMGGMGNGKA